MDWTEISIGIDAENIDEAADIANMAVPYGIYIEDYRNLEKETREIANIDLIDEDLLKKDKSKGVIHLYIPREENPSEAVCFLKERYNICGIKCSIDLNRCKNEDWENNWKEFFKPINIGEKLIIRPLWIDNYENPQNRTVLSIEPGLAFGTGSHNTTRLCLETLEKYITPGCSVLDTGCGSGILSIASLLLGAENATGVDIDELAVKTAVTNGEINGFSAPQYKILQGNLTDKVSGKFDIVVANIVSDIIIMFSKSVGKFMYESSVFIASGIIAARVDEVAESLKANNFKIIEKRRDGDWYCFVCKKQK